MTLIARHERKKNKSFCRCFTCFTVQGKKKEVKRIEGFETPLHTNSNRLYDIRIFAACSAGPIHLKKPSGGPKGLRFFQDCA
jgi:hypothetical protein